MLNGPSQLRDVPASLARDGNRGGAVGVFLNMPWVTAAIAVVGVFSPFRRAVTEWNRGILLRLGSSAACYNRGSVGSCPD